LSLRSFFLFCLRHCGSVLFAGCNFSSVQVRSFVVSNFWTFRFLFRFIGLCTLLRRTYIIYAYLSTLYGSETLRELIIMNYAATYAQQFHPKLPLFFILELVLFLQFLLPSMLPTLRAFRGGGTNLRFF